MAIRYEITHLDDGRYKLVHIGHSGVASTPLSFPPDELEQYLIGSLSKARLEKALQTASSVGFASVEADLEE